MLIPSMILKQLYTFGSLQNLQDGVQFSIKNRLSDAEFTGLQEVKIDGQPVPLADVRLEVGNGRALSPAEVDGQTPVPFPLRTIVHVIAAIPALPEGKHEIEIAFKAKPFGKLKLKVEDAITSSTEDMVRIPRDPRDDYSPEAIANRQKFVEEFTGTKLQHAAQYSFDPHTTQGNIEHFTGVAQIPLGFAGPLTIHGEHAQGDFIIPLATTEGTLVASYNRGMKVVNLSGGVKVSVVADAMQRAPVFVFEDARQGREFVKWVYANLDKIREEAEATSSVARLKDIDPYLASKFVYLRFNYYTGDAAGQNMVGRATFAACSWVLDNYNDGKIKHFYLESNFATDKKASQINIMRTRGKRVTAEAVIKRDVLIQHMRVEPEGLHYHYGVANVGSILSGANNNGLHSANAITAIFIATGQDVANVSESSAGVLYTELTPEKDLYMSLTIPSLIVATYGGGVGLATQRECLETLGCFGKGKVHRFAEIVAGAALAGEISLAAAISSSDWVSSHEQYGRNR
ncbi:MAG: hydroxymethylglutaryl-CoA reductase [Anaerolineales bacterium]|nr:hydroxymethylglutaryl-CoA reductase [Anaerolineales bacterium]